MRPPGKCPELRAGLGPVGGLGEHRPVEIENLIRAKHQRIGVTLAYLSCLELGQGVGDVARTCAFARERLAHRFLVDAGGPNLGFESGIPQKGCTDLRRRSENETQGHGISLWIVATEASG